MTLIELTTIQAALAHIAHSPAMQQKMFDAMRDAVFAMEMLAGSPAIVGTPSKEGAAQVEASDNFHGVRPPMTRIAGVNSGVLERAAMAEAVKDWTYHPGVSAASPSEGGGEPSRASEWIRNHYQDYATIDGLCQALDAALRPSRGEAVDTAWVRISERLPELGQSVALIHEDRYENTGGDLEMNVRACGYLHEMRPGDPYWSIRGERATTLESFTHWLALPAIQSQGAQP